PDPVDAGLTFIGRISTPWTSRLTCPRQGRLDGPVCQIEIFEPWIAGLEGVADFEHLELLYWLDQSRRDLVLQSPASDRNVRGPCALRSPVPPTPIATSIFVRGPIEGQTLFVRGFVCRAAPPLLAQKRAGPLLKPIAPPQPGDF